MRLLLGTAFAVVLPLASALGGALRASDNGRRLARGEECTILVAHLLAIPGESLVEETSFGTSLCIFSTICAASMILNTFVLLARLFRLRSGPP